VLAFTRCAPSPAQPGEDLGAVLAAGASLPAAVAGQQLSCRVRFDSEPGYDSCERTCRATGQLLRNPAQPRHGAQLDRDAEPAVITLEAGQPLTRPSSVGVKKVTAGCSAMSAGQEFRRASSVSDR